MHSDTSVTSSSLNKVPEESLTREELKREESALQTEKKHATQDLNKAPVLEVCLFNI
jgi:hypothetical protein